MRNVTERIPRASAIASRANPLAVRLAKLSQAKFRREEGLFLAEGKKLSAEAAGLPEVEYVLVRAEDGRAEEELVEIAARCPRPERVCVLAPAVFEKISTESAPEGIITVLSPISRLHRMWQGGADIGPRERILALDAVRDPGNLGTVLRTAAAFGYDRLLCCDCADLYHPRTVRASMGALFRVRVDLVPELPAALAALRGAGRRVLAAALREDALRLGRDAIRPDDCVVVGNEGHGVSPETIAACDAAVRIPMAPGTESLNAAGAAAVLMWEYSKPHIL